MPNPTEARPAEGRHPDDNTTPDPEYADLDGDGIPDDLEADDDLSDVDLGATDAPILGG